jgi:hypothetical protein
MVLLIEDVCNKYLRLLLVSETDQNREKPLYFDRILKKLMFMKTQEAEFAIEMDK